MSLGHNVLRCGAAALAVGLAAPVATAPAFADDARSLASVARELGFTYVYLPYENAVSLSRPGVTVVVRPGDSFFFANERREPVYGIVPVYRKNDVYVSRAFVEEIRGLGSRARATVDAVDDATPLSTPPLGAVEPPGTVASAVAGYDARDGRALVTGTATPGSIVGIVLKAELSSSLPVVVLDRTYVIAASDGTFEARLSFGADSFAPSQYVAEAYGVQNAKPVVVRLAPRPASPRTTADDRK